MHNKFLAKIALFGRPRGFSVIGVQDTEKFLKDKPVRLIEVGKAMQQSLEGSGIRTFSDLLRGSEKILTQNSAKWGTAYGMPAGGMHGLWTVALPEIYLKRNNIFEDTSISTSFMVIYGECVKKSPLAPK